MKIFNIITTLCVISLFTVMTSFGMGKKPNKDDKAKKVFGPHLPAKKIPTEKDLQKAQELPKPTDHQNVNDTLFDLCNDLSQLTAPQDSLRVLLSAIDTHLSVLNADPNYTHTNKHEPFYPERPLHVAVRNQRAWQAVKSLLNGKADVNALDYSKRTALHIATLKKNDIAVDLLLKAGAHTHIRDKAGKTPMGYLQRADPYTAHAYYKHDVVPQLLNASSTTQEQEEQRYFALRMLSVLNKYPDAQREYQAEREQVGNQIVQHSPIIAPLVALVTDYISSKELLSTEDWSKTRAWPLVTLEPSPSTQTSDLDENKDDASEAEHQLAPTYQRDEDNPSSLKYIPPKSNNNKK